MSEEITPKSSIRFSLLRNWLSLVGLAVVVASVFAFLLLFVLDALAHFANPYIGVLTYLIAPCFAVIGAVLAASGALWRHRKVVKSHGLVPQLQIDLTKPRDRRTLGYFVTAGVVFLLITAMGSYHSYHFTESVQFCGQACHTVMQPELVTYRHSPHARVACAECHIGKGAKWYVRSKLSGTYQVYATLAAKFPRPIPTPIKNLRPAQETCEECHWPKKFVGNLDRTFSYFLGDETNTPFAVRLLMKVGGGDPTHGPVGGIHWHMNVGKKVEYISARQETNGAWAEDPSRQKIPWVRLTDAQGAMTEFRIPRFTNAISQFNLRTMDCMDCHNRPAHRFETPNDAVNLAMSLGKIQPGLPWIKTNAVFALTQRYQDETDALQKIATFLAQRYPNDPRIPPTIDMVQQIYKDNFFPEMKADWQSYPDNIGHMEWPGCFRCHDGNHSSADGKRSIKANDCNACHVILAQGSGAELENLKPNGHAFKHPGDPLNPGDQCHDCHTGGP